MKTLLFLCLLFISGELSAQIEYKKSTFVTKDGKVLPYRILFPKNYDSTQKYPLVLFLHGAGERGTDNEKQLVHGSALFLDEKNRENFPAIIIFPQCPEEASWASIKVDRSKQPYDIRFDYSDAPSWPLKASTDLVKQFIKEKKADKNRIYIMGLSMGGMGTFEAISRYPKLFAAAAPICGGGDISYCKKYARRVSIWIFHGSEDLTVNPQYSRYKYGELQSLKADVRYTEYAGVGHNSWDNAFAEPTLLSWIFGQSRK